MGWWDDTELDGAVTGDEALDEAFEFLKRLSYVYEDGFGRKPSVADLQATLRICLRVNADERFFSDMKEKKITRITIKTAKAPKKKIYTVGDVFRLPLGDDRFAYGRLLKVDKRGCIAEIFRHVDQGEGFRPSIADSGRLFHPIFVSGSVVFWRGPWEVIHSDPDFVHTDVNDLKFVYGVHGDRKMVQGDKHTEISEEEAKKLEPAAFVGHLQVVERIKKALK